MNSGGWNHTHLHTNAQRERGSESAHRYTQAIIKNEQNRVKYYEKQREREGNGGEKTGNIHSEHNSQKVDAMLKTHQPLLSYPYDWHCWQFHSYYQQHLYRVNCSIASSHQWHRLLYAVVNVSTKCAPHNTTADIRLLIKYQRISATVALHHFPQLKMKMKMIIMRNFLFRNIW